MIKRLRLLLSAIALVVVPGMLITTPVTAQLDPLTTAEVCTPGSKEYGTDFCKNARTERNRPFYTGDGSVLVMIARTIIYITAAVSVIMIIIGGFRYVISNGDANGIQGAKNTILYAIIGLIVAAFSQVIVSFVLSRFVN